MKLESIVRIIGKYYMYHNMISFSQFIKLTKKIKKPKNFNKWDLLVLKDFTDPFYYRPGSSDISIVTSFFLKRNYAKTIPGANHIIDAGANIGAATVVFKKRYPFAEVVAIEPDEENCKLFRKNTSCFQNIELLEGGLTAIHGKHLKISNPTAASYSFQLDYSDEGLPSYSINEIMKERGWKSLDIVKVDIEGGEKELFELNTEWMNVTKQIIIELHDSKTRGCSRSLIQALQEHDFAITISGENLILTNCNSISK